MVRLRAKWIAYQEHDSCQSLARRLDNVCFAGIVDEVPDADWLIGATCSLRAGYWGYRFETAVLQRLSYRLVLPAERIV